MQDIQKTIDSYQWFHSFDFGDDLKATGVKSTRTLRKEADAVFGPLDLRGKTVLDVGAWNGFFSFEAEKRGASRVLATDHFVWNHPGFRGRETFDLARTLLHSGVKPMDVDIPGLPEVGRFDIVLFLGVFYHLQDAVNLTRMVSGLASEVLILETVHDAIAIPGPAMVYYPGAELSDDDTNWWGPNQHMIYALLKECGFNHVFFTGTLRSRTNPRGVYHAFRGDPPDNREWVDLGNSAARFRLFRRLPAWK